MEIKLNSLENTNFAGTEHRKLIFGGKDTEIKGENGAGKTRLANSFFWLLFGKNTKGETNFKFRPMDEDNVAIKGLVVAVEGELTFDDKTHVLRRENHEIITKKDVTGYETMFKIDDVPMTMTEYNKYIRDIIPEDVFRSLTDLMYFNTLDWNEQRIMLRIIAGDIEPPEGFDKLTGELNGRTVKAYKKVLLGQKKIYEKERAEINPRLDEVQKRLDNTAITSADKGKIEKQRKTIEAEVFELDLERKGLTDSEQERLLKLDEINKLRTEKIEREAILKTDTSAIADKLEEKRKIEEILGEANRVYNNNVNKAKNLSGDIESRKGAIEFSLRALEAIRTEARLQSENHVDKKCYKYDIICNQIPADKLVEVEEKRKTALAETIRRGNATKARLVKQKDDLAAFEAVLVELKEEIEKNGIQIKEVLENKKERFAIIDKLIATNETIPPSSDFTWREIVKKIENLEAQIPDNISEKIQLIDNLKTENQNKLAGFNAVLANSDQAKKDAGRIKELEASEKDLAQKIADVDEMLLQISLYEADESRKIEDSVNRMFEHIKFKLFDQLLGGEYRECCEAMLNGIPFRAMSDGEKIFAGVDIINVLSAYHGKSVVLFVDHAESLTLPIEPKSQTIKLYAKKGIKELTIEQEQ